MVETEIKGLDQVIGKLRKLPRKLRTKYLSRALRAGSRIIIDDAKNSVATADKNLTLRGIEIPAGNIRSHISARGTAKAGDAAYRVSIGVRSDKSIHTYYWRFIEFGTEKMAARPFLRPAGEENTGAVISAVVDKLRADLRKDGITQ